MVISLRLPPKPLNEILVFKPPLLLYWFKLPNIGIAGAANLPLTAIAVDEDVAPEFPIDLNPLGMQLEQEHPELVGAIMELYGIR